MKKEDKIAYWVVGIGMIIGLAFIIGSFVTLPGCGHIQFSGDAKNILARAAGANLAYFTLKNNPDYVGKVEMPLRAAIETASDDGVDVEKLYTMIMDWINERIMEEMFAEYQGIILLNMNTLKSLVTVDIDMSIPEQRLKALKYIQEFLDGALEGLEAVKAQQSLNA